MKFGDFETPFGKKGNVFSLGSWGEMILGVVVFLIAVATGQKIVNTIPANKVIDTTIEPLTAAPVAGSNLTAF